MWEYLKFWAAKDLWHILGWLLLIVLILLAYAAHTFWYYSRWSKASKANRARILDLLSRSGTWNAFNLEVNIVGLSKMGTPHPDVYMFKSTITRLLKQGVIRKCIVKGEPGYELVTDAFKVGE